MANGTTLSTFRISDENLDADPSISEAYNDYGNKRYALHAAFKDLKEATRKLHDLLEGPLRSASLIPEGKDWTFKEDAEDGLFIQVWSEPKQRGRRKPEVPIKQLPIRSQIKGPRAA
jgi:hypothetical protein